MPACPCSTGCPRGRVAERVKNVSDSTDGQFIHDGIEGRPVVYASGGFNFIPVDGLLVPDTERAEWHNRVIRACKVLIVVVRTEIGGRNRTILANGQ